MTSPFVLNFLWASTNMGIPDFSWFVSEELEFNQLLQKVYEVTGWDYNEWRVQLRLLVPSETGFNSFLLGDENSMQILFAYKNSLSVAFPTLTIHITQHPVADASNAGLNPEEEYVESGENPEEEYVESSEEDEEYVPDSDSDDDGFIEFGGSSTGWHVYGDIGNPDPNNTDYFADMPVFWDGEDDHDDEEDDYHEDY